MGKPEGKYHLEELGVDGSISVKMSLTKLGREVMDWINVDEDKDMK